MSAQNHIDLLGKTVKDKVTGYEGVAISVSFDLFGCIQIIVRPPAKEGKLDDSCIFDINRLDITNDERVMPVPAFDAKAPKFGKTPASHAHGPAEKPKTRRL